jgi:hypothetical protein
VQDIDPVLVRLLTQSEDVTAIRAENLEGSFSHEEVLLTVQALHEHFLYTQICNREVLTLGLLLI